MKDVPPADSNAEDTLRRYPKSRKGLTADADAATFGLWKALKECRTGLKEMEEREANLTDALKMATGEAEALSYTDKDTGEVKTLATWKSSLREVFDEEGFQREFPDKWMKYSRADTTVSLDRKALERDEPEVYGKYSSKVCGSRKFLIK